MRYRVFVAFGVAVALAAGVALGARAVDAAAPEPTTADLVADWVNVDAATRHILRLVLSNDAAGSLQVHGFGACSPPCDWGTTSATAYSTGIGSGQGIAFTAFYDFGLSDTLLTGAVHGTGSDRTLDVAAFTRFKDGSGRYNYTLTDRFRPTGGPATSTCATTAGGSAATFKSTKSGAWNDRTVWDCASVPRASDNVALQADHAVTLNVPGQARDLTIAAGATVNGSAATLELHGDWKQDGAYAHGGGTVMLKGQGKQRIGGAAPAKKFSKLQVDKAALSTPAADDAADAETDDTVEIEEELRVSKGQVSLGNAKSKHVDIGLGAKLKSKEAPAGQTPVTLEVTGNWTQHGAYEHGKGQLRLTGQGKQVISGSAASKKFHKLEMSKVALSTPAADAVADVETDDTVECEEELRLTKGQGTLGSTKTKHVVIDQGARLAPKQGKQLEVTGHWRQDGAHEPSQGLVKFTGQGKQAIDGAAQTKRFHKVEVSKADAIPDDATAVEADDSVETAEELRVSKGQATLGGTKSKHVDIGLGAKLKSKPGKQHEVAGNLKQQGDYEPNQGKVVFTGAVFQTIGGPAPATFYDFTVRMAQPSGVLTSALAGLTVTNKLKVQTGTFVTGTTLNDVEIDATGTLQAAPGGTLIVLGDWTNNGTFVASTGTVRFVANSPQVIGGGTSTTFANLTFNNPSGVTIATSISVNGTLTPTTRPTLPAGAVVWQGFFRPVDNLPAINSVNAGRNIPVKFKLGGNKGLAIFAAGYPTSPSRCRATPRRTTPSRKARPTARAARPTTRPATGTPTAGRRTRPGQVPAGC